MNKLFTLNELMDITKLSERTIRRYLKQDKLTGVKVGKEWRFTEENVKELFSKIEFSSQISSLANEKVKQFIEGNYETKEDHRMLSIFDIDNLTKTQHSKVKMMLMRISNNHNNIDMKFNTKDDKTRITLIGNIDYIYECVNELKTIMNH
ncbi:MAG: helix-turn-helix domain-containing protein [Candidatus Izimaplasma sp.]|nr:helix-turn-helix domain-containing protein [Candidatus Izimaplasma bacterium]